MQKNKIKKHFLLLNTFPPHPPPPYVITNNSKRALLIWCTNETKKGQKVKKRKEKKKGNPSNLTWGLVKITASFCRVGCGRYSIWWIKDLLFSAKRLLARRRKERVFDDARQAGGHHLEPFWFEADAGGWGRGEESKVSQKGCRRWCSQRWVGLSGSARFSLPQSMP